MPLDANPPRTKGAGKMDLAWIGEVNRAPEWEVVLGIFGDIPCVSTSAPKTTVKPFSSWQLHHLGFKVIIPVSSSFGLKTYLPKFFQIQDENRVPSKRILLAYSSPELP